MGWTDTIRESIVNWLLPVTREDRERAAMLQAYEQRRLYREGVQRKPLKVKIDQANDNITLNFTGLIVDRGISMLVGGGVDFDFGMAEGDNSNIRLRLDIDTMGNFRSIRPMAGLVAKF